MTDQPEQPQPDLVRHARRFTAHHQGMAMHGVQFPSGRILADHPYAGLMGYASVEDMTDDREDVTLDWADEPGPDVPRRFHLQRTTDVTGVSGTGRVADGVLWPDGAVSIRWRGDRPSTVAWDSLADAEYVHGHGGATRIVWDDPAPAPARESEAAVEQGPPAPVHACPRPVDNGLAPCCGRPPFEFRGERLTKDPALVTCRVNAEAAAAGHTCDRTTEADCPACQEAERALARGETHL